MKYKHILKVNRLEISILLNKSYSVREIGRSLGKNPSSISREISSNSTNGIYDPHKANNKARVKRICSKYQGMKVVSNMELRDYIDEKMKIGWTPEQIAGRLNRKSGNPVISAKSIYKYLYSPYGQCLCRYLPSKRYIAKRRSGRKLKKQIIPNRISIEFRPKVINERRRFGDWEADTLGRIKTDNEAIAGLVERKSRYVLACKVPKLKYAMDGFKKLLNPYHNLLKSLTMDNGVENVRHEELNTNTYFCHPYSSWEKGAIENSFQRLRRFIPKKSSLRNYTDERISDIINLMNNTPRKCLDYRTPKEVFNEQLSLHTNLTGVALEGKM